MGRDHPCLAVAMAVAAALVAPKVARADDVTPSPPLRKVQVGVELGFSFPMGDLARGSEVGDVVHWIVPLGFEARYRFNRTVALVIQGAYAFGIPTLCATPSDCMASLGHDISLGIGGRFTLPRVGPALPQVRATFGYEWF